MPYKLENLSVEEIEMGCYLIVENSEQMISDADILFNASRFASAYNLYKHSLEEVGNSYFLLELLVDVKVGNPTNYRRLNREFTLNKTKNSIAFEKVALLRMFSDSNYGNAKERQNLLTTELDKLEVDAIKLNTNRSNSLYVDLKDGRFVSPKHDITKEITVEIKDKAITRLKAAKGLLKIFVQNLDQLPERIESFRKEGKRLDVEILKGFFKD